MKYKHTNRKGFLIAFIDIITAGLFLLFYMPMGLERELEEILGHKIQRYYVAYILGIPDFFIYTLIWMANIAEELKEKAIELGIEGKHTSFWNMFGWNMFGIVILIGPMIATHYFFDTLNKIEIELNRRESFDS